MADAGYPGQSVPLGACSSSSEGGGARREERAGADPHRCRSWPGSNPRCPGRRRPGRPSARSGMGSGPAPARWPGRVPPRGRPGDRARRSVFATRCAARPAVRPVRMPVGITESGLEEPWLRIARHSPPMSWLGVTPVRRWSSCSRPSTGSCSSAGCGSLSSRRSATKASTSPRRSSTTTARWSIESTSAPSSVGNGSCATTSRPAWRSSPPSPDTSRRTGAHLPRSHREHRAGCRPPGPRPRTPADGRRPGSPGCTGQGTP